jgi:hypothetical protein
MKFDDLTDRDAYLIQPDATVEALRAAGPRFTLAELQRAVAGSVEVVQVPAPYLMLVNEDGLSRWETANVTASVLAGQRIVGPAVVLRRSAFGP